MDINQFKEHKTGKIIRVDGMPGITHSFIPNTLPPMWNDEVKLYPLIVEANAELARLDGIGQHLPNPQLLIWPLHHLEAQMSLALEGTITHQQQQMLFDMDPEEIGKNHEKRNALLEVSNYKKALRFRSTKYKDLPISLRLVRELHRILLEGVQGDKSDPGNFRRLPVQIGRPARYVPPPANELLALLNNLENFIYQDTPQYNPLVKSFIIHYQFEAIHPFMDGNGRVGRLLLSLMIEEYCNLANQWLYLSSYFQKNRDGYLDHLLKVSTEGDWLGWLEFCLTGVIEEAKSTQIRCKNLLEKSQEYHQLLTNCGKNNTRLMNIVDNLFISPFLTIPILQRQYGVTWITVRNDIQCLIDIGILSEASEKWGRAKIYFASSIFDIIYKKIDS